MTSPNLENLSGEISLLAPKPGDVVMISCPGHLETDTARSIASELGRALPEGVKGIVLDGGIEHIAITDEMVDRASAEFAAWKPSRPTHREAMRAALEAAFHP